MFPDSCYFLRISSGVGLFFEQFLICRLRPSCLQDIHVTFSSKWFFLNRQHFMWHCSRHPVQLMLYLLNITFLSSRLHCQQLTHEVVVVQHSMLQLTVHAWPVGADLLILLQSLSWLADPAAVTQLACWSCSSHSADLLILLQSLSWSADPAPVTQLTCWSCSSHSAGLLILLQSPTPVLLIFVFLSRLETGLDLCWIDCLRAVCAPSYT